MNFDEQLKEMMGKVDGAKAAILMGFDGIPVSEVKEDDAAFSFQDLVVEYSRLLGDFMKVSEGGGAGMATEIMVTVDQHKVILRVLNSNYFIALLLRGDGNVGKGRYILAQNSSELSANL